MTDETGPDIERLTQEMRAFSAYELAAQACQHLNNAAASIRAAHRAMHALGDPQAIPTIEEARRAASIWMPPLNHLDNPQEQTTSNRRQVDRLRRASCSMRAGQLKAKHPTAAALVTGRWLK